MGVELKVKNFGYENFSDVLDNSNNIFSDYVKGFKKQIIFISSKNDKNSQIDNIFEEICSLLNQVANFGDIKSKLLEIREIYLSKINELGLNDTEKEKFISVIDFNFERMLFDIYFWFNREDKIYPNSENNFSINSQSSLVSIKQFLELMMSYIYKYSINNTGLRAEIVEFNGVVPENNDSINKRFLIDIMTARVSNKILGILKNNEIAILQENTPNGNFDLTSIQHLVSIKIS